MRVQGLMLNRILLLVAIISCIGGCSGQIGAGELAGSYKLTQANGFEILDLRENGNYVCEVHTSKGMKKTYSSTWKFEPFDGEPKVFVEDFPQGSVNADQRPLVGTLLGIRKSWGRIRLYVSYDENLYFSKQFPPTDR